MGGFQQLCDLLAGFRNGGPPSRNDIPRQCVQISARVRLRRELGFEAATYHACRTFRPLLHDMIAHLTRSGVVVVCSCY